MKMITPDKSKIENYQFRRESEFYFKHCFVGDVYKKWTDYLTQNDIYIEVKYDEYDTEWIKTTGYAPDITHMCYEDVDNGIYKIIWHHQNSAPFKSSNDISIEFKNVFTDLFCVEGWEHEERFSNYESSYGHNEYKEGYARTIGDIRLYTKPWVEYLTFQGYRTIVQFNLFDYIKNVHREEQINSILN